MNRFLPSTLCTKCGEWVDFNLQSIGLCEFCGQDKSKSESFYSFCLKLEEEMPSSLQDRIRKILEPPDDLRHGWGPEVLAVISAFVLGLITNASYDMLKTWMLSRREKYKLKYRHHIAYEKLVESLFDYILENAEEIKKINLDKSKFSLETKDDN